MEVDEAVLGALAEARALGFLGPGPLEPHVASAAAFAQVLGPFAGRALDLGSGGGVPGLLLAATYEDVEWTLVDVNRRRTSFLARTVAALGWTGRVQVVRGGAEELAHDAAHRRGYAAVSARSFAPPAITAEVASGFLAPSGVLLVAEPPQEDAGRWPADGLSALGLRREPSGSPSVALLRACADPVPETPRRWRAMERHPHWS